METGPSKLLVGERQKSARGRGADNGGTGQARECGDLLENPRGILWC